MGNIEKVSRIKRERLSSEKYFQSLLEEAYSAKLLSDNELERIQFDCLALLAKKTERYNMGDSSSIGVDKAQDLLSTIMFTVGVELKNYKNPDDGIEVLQRDGVDSIYKAGYKRIEGLVKQAKMLQSTIICNLFETKNVFYSSTVVDGINGFFKLYYPEFESREIHITADYPVYKRMEPLLGIEFIGKYLEYIYYENEFCTKFSSEDVHHLLCGYDEKYESLLFNIYEQVLTSAIGCILTGGDLLRLERTPSSTKVLIALFQGKSRVEIQEVLTTALEELSEAMEISDSLKHYLSGSLPKIAVSVENAVSLNTLDNVFIIPRYPENNPKISVSFGEKMDDEKYREFLEEFMQCRHLEDKKAMIKTQIHSLGDLEDILLDGELYEEEILSIIKDLNPVEIAALLKKHPLPSDLDLYDMRESEILLREVLQKYLVAILPKQQEMMKQAITMLDNTKE